MKLLIRKSKKFLIKPSHFNDLTNFVCLKINNTSLINLFSFIISFHSNFSKFEKYYNSFLPQNIEEKQLVNKIFNFYKKAEEKNNLDNERGDLLENICKKIADSKLNSDYIAYYSVVLNLEHNNCCVFTTHPEDIDFYIEHKIRKNSKGIECRVKVFEKDKKMVMLNNFSKKIVFERIPSILLILHLTTQQQWLKKYQEWFPHLLFVSPFEVVNQLN